MITTDKPWFRSPRKLVLAGLTTVLVAGAPVTAIAATHTTGSTAAQRSTDALTPGDTADAPRDVPTPGDTADASRDVPTPGDTADAPHDVLTPGDTADAPAGVR
jgi:hypothetical protein